MTDQPLKTCRFALGDRVRCKAGLGRIMGYEDGRNLGRWPGLSAKATGWVYHVILDEDERTVLIPEENLLVDPAEEGYNHGRGSQ